MLSRSAYATSPNDVWKLAVTGSCCVSPKPPKSPKPSSSPSSPDPAVVSAGVRKLSKSSKSSGAVDGAGDIPKAGGFTARGGSGEVGAPHTDAPKVMSSSIDVESSCRRIPVTEEKERAGRSREESAAATVETGARPTKSPSPWSVTPSSRHDLLYPTFFMSMSEYSFLFSSLGSKQPTTTRKAHIRRLCDILQLCVQRQDWTRAKRSWAILARCPEIDWKAMWRTSVLLLGEGNPEDTDESQANGDRVRFLSVMMRQHPGEVRGFAGPWATFRD